MFKQNSRNSILTILGSLGWPLLFGSIACSIFYMLVYQGPLNLSYMHRYFASHPVSILATGMFFVGMATLLLKLSNVLMQYFSLGNELLEETPTKGQKVEDCSFLLDELEESSGRMRDFYLVRRLRDILSFVERKGSASGLDDELKYLADLDAARQQDGYALSRIIIWATPMLGFLGTVIGITQALGDLNAEQLATNPQAAMDGLLAGLYIAFDTTALALSLSILLMFVQFFIDRIETQLLSTVDARINEEIVGRFEQLGTVDDPHVASVQMMCGNVLHATEQLVSQQAKIWQSSMDESQQQWSQMSRAVGDQLQESLGEALKISLTSHVQLLLEGEKESSERASLQWEKWQTSLSENAKIMQSQQQEITRQSEIMSQILGATGDVIKLEQVLNENLRALSGSKNFEDTVMSLSAAIHLLNTRLGGALADVKTVNIQQNATEGRAA